MNNLTKIRQCRDRIRSQTHLLRRQPARQRHAIALAIDKANNDLGWYLDQLLQETDDVKTA